MQKIAYIIFIIIALCVLTYVFSNTGNNIGDNNSNTANSNDSIQKQMYQKQMYQTQQTGGSPLANSNTKFRNGLTNQALRDIIVKPFSIRIQINSLLVQIPIAPPNLPVHSTRRNTSMMYTSSLPRSLVGTR